MESSLKLGFLSLECHQRTPNSAAMLWCHACPPSDPYWTMTSISLTSVCKLVKHKASHTQHSTMQLVAPCTVISELIGPHNEWHFSRAVLFDLIWSYSAAGVPPWECPQIAILRDTLVLFFVWCWACWLESSPLAFTLPPITQFTLPRYT